MTTSIARQRSILVTGCSSGIGLAAAQALHARGYRVFASARRAEDLARLRAMGMDAHYLDTADSASIAACVDSVLAATGGGLDAVFHNAGYGQSGALEDLPRAALRLQFEANVFGVHELNALLLPVMRRQGYGRIIINSSVLGFVALKFRGAYAASKYALEAIADTLRLELEGTPIHVSLIEPGPVESRFRPNSLAAFARYVGAPQASAHAEAYRKFIANLKHEGPITKWTLPATACVPPLLHALESKKPKARYAVTFPTHALTWLKRLLPASILDKVLQRGL